MEQLLNQLGVIVLDNLETIIVAVIALFTPNPKVRKILGKIANGINKSNSKSDK